MGSIAINDCTVFYNGTLGYFGNSEPLLNYMAIDPDKFADKVDGMIRSLGLDGTREKIRKWYDAIAGQAASPGGVQPILRQAVPDSQRNGVRNSVDFLEQVLDAVEKK